MLVSPFNVESTLPFFLLLLLTLLLLLRLNFDPQ